MFLFVSKFVSRFTYILSSFADLFFAPISRSKPPPRLKLPLALLYPNRSTLKRLIYMLLEAFRIHDVSKHFNRRGGRAESGRERRSFSRLRNTEIKKKIIHRRSKAKLFPTFFLKRELFRYFSISFEVILRGILDDFPSSETQNYSY